MNEIKEENKLFEIPKNKLSIFLIILVFILLNSCVIFNICNKENAKKDIIRLHVVANSNSVDDQITKLKISSKIQDYLKTLNFTNKESSMKLLKENKDKVLEIANSTLNEENMGYSSSINLGRINYDEKQSVELDMEQGTYDSMQVVLGKGEGKNFWTLIFPSKENIQKVKAFDTIMPELSNIYIENENIENTTNEYSFKLLEILNDIFK